MFNKKDDSDLIFNEKEEAEIAEEFKRRKREEIIEKVKSVGKNLGILLIICVIGYGIFFSDSKDKKTDELAAEKTEESIEKKNFIDKYDPIIFSDEDFKFTKDIQDKVNKKFLLEGDIEDLYNKNGKIFIKFDNLFDCLGIFEIDEAQENFIRSNMDNKASLHEFLVIVEIKNVFKPELEIKGEIDDDHVYLEAYSADIFFLEGKLVDIEINK